MVPEGGPIVDEQVKRKRPSYSDEFKQDAVRLVVEEGYSFRKACQAVGVCEAPLRSWHAKLSPLPESCGEDATMKEMQAELKRLRRQLKQTELEREILKKSHGVLRERVDMKHAWIKRHRDQFPVATMCRLLKVSRSGYYASVERSHAPLRKTLLRLGS